MVRPQVRRPDWGTIVVALGVVYGVVFLGWQLLGRADAHATMVVSDVAFLPVSLLACVLAWRVAATRSIGRSTRRAWFALGLAFALNLLGDLLWFLEEVVLGRSPFPSPADAPYLAFYLALLVGLFLFPVAPRSRQERRRLALDVGTVIVAASMVIWYLVLGPTTAAEGSPVLTTALAAAYPVGDIVLVFGVGAVLARGTLPSSRRALGILLVGIVGYVVADVAFGALSLDGSYRSGDWPDTVWLVSTLLVAVSAWVQRRGAMSGEAPARERPIRSGVSLIPYLAIAAVWGMVLYAARAEPLFPMLGLLTGGLLLTLVVVTRQLLAVRENSELTRLYQELAATDVLTGLPNRRRFWEQASEDLVHDDAARLPTSLLMIDVDHFKAVNDGHGHATGDRLLRAVAERLRASLRHTDVIARFGGDEFVVLLPACPRGEADVTATRVRASVATLKDPVPVTLSIGTATMVDADLDELLRRADAALYAAKDAGRDCARTFDEPLEPVTTEA